jgi:uncharacterized protein (TIGR00730 family)
MMRRLGLCLRTSWRLFRVFLQTVYGVFRISKLQEPIVSIFGGARFPGDDRYFKKAHELGRRLAELDISVLTGGGPGIMEAASCGVTTIPKKNVRIMGIGVTDLDEKPSECAQEYFALDDFFARKWLLTHFSSGFVVFPGGFGTLDELSEVLTLIQTKKLKRVPIILVGTEYWNHFIAWLKDEALKHHTISEEDLNLFTVTDDLEKVYCLIRDECKVEK